MRECSKKCVKEASDCLETECRYWIEYPEDHNCSLISIEENGKMTLEEVGKRLKLSFVRVSQIEKEALKKFKRLMTK